MSGPEPETGTPPATGATEGGLAGASGRGVAGGGGSDVPQLVGRAGVQIFFPSRERYHDLLAELQVEGFEMLADLCGVDYLTHPGRTLPAGVEPERFEVAVVLRRLDPPGMVRIRVQVPEADPVLASAWDLYPGAEAMERECFDMFGIRFVGHPDLTRILMPEDWEGHPLRKDYGVGRVPVQFKEAPGPR
ncbi:NADH-quinone oxidoreductase subunit C [Aciditerrimonas ferrireducens]|uniref:NADH-quinone oxidoreductase subunit C n=1 Tax=Aciditerrimonas ferrireducens TaxID=667306 RepID=UPI0020034CF2|nr:NADH-quinone oxidoreductase subunit C [Aciditerrimonas ferrireducens]MCK4176923.1 NADH-quinone oxidoreductase subunit C [Aciditerrimonas ferrireducens]